MVAKSNTVRITQPYQGDRGSLRVLVEAENLPAGAYGDLEPVFEAAEKWAEKWLSAKTGDGGVEIPWWETAVRDLPLDTRAKNPLIRVFGGEAPVSKILDRFMDDQGELDEMALVLPGFGRESLRSFENWVELQEDEHGNYEGEVTEIKPA